MKITCSVWIAKGMGLEQRRRLYQAMRLRLRNPDYYAGHSYSDTICFEDDIIDMKKNVDDSIVLFRCGDGAERMYEFVY